MQHTHTHTHGLTSIRVRGAPDRAIPIGGGNGFITFGINNTHKKPTAPRSTVQPNRLQHVQHVVCSLKKHTHTHTPREHGIHGNHIGALAWAFLHDSDACSRRRPCVHARQSHHDWDVFSLYPFLIYISLCAKSCSRPCYDTYYAACPPTPKSLLCGFARAPATASNA